MSKVFQEEGGDKPCPMLQETNKMKAEIVGECDESRCCGIWNCFQRKQEVRWWEWQYREFLEKRSQEIEQNVEGDVKLRKDSSSLSTTLPSFPFLALHFLFHFFSSLSLFLSSFFPSFCSSPFLSPSIFFYFFQDKSKLTTPCLFPVGSDVGKKKFNGARESEDRIAEVLSLRQWKGMGFMP